MKNLTVVGRAVVTIGAVMLVVALLATRLHLSADTASQVAIETSIGLGVLAATIWLLLTRPILQAMQEITNGADRLAEGDLNLESTPPAATSAGGR